MLLGSLGRILFKVALLDTFGGFNGGSNLVV
jgi:hypothetical protein